jgi:hypothetical protein
MSSSRYLHAGAEVTPEVYVVHVESCIDHEFISCRHFAIAIDELFEFKSVILPYAGSCCGSRCMTVSALKFPKDAAALRT